MQKLVLFDARLVIDKPTGIGRYVTSLLPEMIRQGTDFHFHLLRGAQPWAGFGMHEWEAPNLTHHISNDKTMSLRQHLLLPRMAKRLGASLLHYPHFDAPVLFGSVPVIATIHDARDLARPDFFIGKSRLKRAYMRFFIAQSFKRATVITVSHASARDLSRHFDFPVDRIPVIHEAVDLEFEPADETSVAAFRAKYGLQRPFILCIGERRPHKNQARLVRAYAESQARTTHDLVIIGKVYSDFRLPEQTAAELGLTDTVHVLDPVSPDELVAAYTGAALFVLISLYEGFGLPLLEAMACSTPVIGSSTTATGEVTGDGGITVDPEDVPAVSAAIDEVLGDPARSAELIEKGHAWAAKFSWQRTAEGTLAVYRDMVSRSA